MNLSRQATLGCLYALLALPAKATDLPKTIQGLYMNSVNECPQALTDLKKTGAWSGAMISANQIQYADKSICKIYNVDLGTQPITLQMFCSKHNGEMIQATISLEHNVLTILSTTQNQSLYRCTESTLKTDSATQKLKNTSGIDLGDGVKLSPKANNNSAGFKMKLPM